MLIDLLDNLIFHYERHWSSLIAKIYGLFTIRSSRFAPVHFILMESTCKKILPHTSKLCFDLKVSTLDRHVPLSKDQFLKATTQFSYNGVLKDLNLLAIQK